MGINLQEGLDLPQGIEDVCVAIIKRGNALQDGSDTMDGLTKASTWEGESGDAARHGNDVNGKNLKHSAMDNLKIAASGKRLITEAQDIADRIRALVADALNTEPAMDIDLRAGTVTAPNTEYMDDEAKGKVAAKVQRLQGEIANLLSALELVDADLAQVIKGGTGQSGIDTATIGDHDAQALMSGTMTPEEAARLERVLRFSPDELAAYKQGRLTIPAADMAYMDSMMRNLDGQSPGQIKAMFDKAGIDSGKFTDAMNVVSDPKVTVTGTNTALKRGDYGYIPAKGSFENLPSGVRDTLTKLNGNNSVEAFQPGTQQNFNDLADIMSKGNPAMMQGSELNGHMLDQASKMLEATRDTDHAFQYIINPDFQKSVVDTSQHMLTAAGRDQVAVHDFVAGTNGHSYNDKFIGNVLTQNWSDGGAGAGTMLHNLDTTDPRSGETVRAFDQYAASHDLLNMPDYGGKSLGEVNPELTKALAQANTPYLDDMVANKLDGTSGFDVLDNPSTDASMPRTRELFAVLDSNPDAANILNSKADLDALQYQQHFGQSVIDGHGTTSDLQSEGTMRGLVQGGALDAATDATHDANQAAALAHENQSKWLAGAKSLAEGVPVVKEFVERIPDSLLEKLIVGDAPTPASAPTLAIDSGDALKQAIAQQLFSANIGDQGQLAPYFNNSGGLKTFDEVGSDGLSGYRTALDRYLSAIDPNMATQILESHISYTDVVK